MNWRDLLARITGCAVVLFVVAFQASAQNWQIVPGQSAGPINSNTSEKELIKIFGKQNVRRMAIDVGEGETLPGTVLFPNDPRKRARILWHDSTLREKPQSISFRDKNSFWKTDRGITIGTTLKMIQQLNGRAFAMTGFAWDYSGTVLDCNGGQLREFGIEGADGLIGRTLILRLEPLPAMQRSREYQEMAGDGKFLSDNPAMQKLNPRVYEMIVEFPE